jgi:hypothetical protein
VALSIGLVMAAVGVAMPSVFPVADSGSQFTTQTNAPMVAALPSPAPASNSPEIDSHQTDSPPQPSMSGLGPVAVQLTSPPPPDAKGNEPGEAVTVPTENPATRDLNNAYTQPSPDTAAGGQGGQISELVQAVPPDPTRDALIYGGLAVAILSVALLALAWMARRYFADPLLR